MADSTSSSSGKSKNLPNFYSAVGGMDKYAGGGAGGAGKSSTQSAADAGEKVKSVTTLLEVVRKMDAMESDPENKKLLEQVAGLVEQYMTKLQPGVGDKSGKPPAAAGGDPGAGGAGAAGAAGATVGDTTSASAAM